MDTYNPAPQFTPSAYQPGGLSYTGLSGGTRLPYNPIDVRSKVNQSIVAPDLHAALGTFASNRGISFRSPGVVAGAMAKLSPILEANASNRAMIPLQMEGENASTSLSGSIQDRQHQLAMMGLQAQAMQNNVENQFRLSQLQRQAATQNRSPIMQLLGPLTGMMHSLM